MRFLTSNHPVLKESRPHFGKVVLTDPANPGTVYSIGPTGGGNVSRSTNSGTNWSTVTLPEGCNTPGQLICSLSLNLDDLVIVPAGSAAPPGPSISASGVINAASYQPGIVPNSWVTILGTNLAPRTDDWSNAIVNGRLPASLDGVSVLIGGKAALVYFISAGQLNVLAPDLPPGPTTVTVTTPAGVSAAAPATVVPYAPAFFPWPGNQAVATRQDYSFAAKPGTFSGVTTAAAKPGEILGFSRRLGGIHLSRRTWPAGRSARRWPGRLGARLPGCDRVSLRDLPVPNSHEILICS